MRRDSSGSTLFLDTGFERIPVPLVEGVPDFTQFPEPMQSQLQVIWQNFVESGASLEVVPDPEPTLSSDWSKFNLAMLESSFTDWLSTFPEAYRVAAIQAAANRNLEQFQQFYDLLVQTKKPLSSETAEWQSVADKHNVPMRF